MQINTEAKLVIRLTNLQSKFQKKLGSSFSLHGISFTEYLVLRQLGHAPEKRLRRIDLANEIGLTPSGVTRLLNPMEKIGLVTKEQAVRDARVSLVAITDAGERILEDATKTFNETSKELLSSVNGEELELFSNIVATLL
ncbi:MAG TPA: MarR family transcriptional regulator [Balneolales bacterium]|nr:MarR family transcriptional regulator [Balneolales bacterium]